jgi:DNA-binding LytR/AlgR family response regulator
MLIPNFPETFVRVHRSFAINLFHIKSYNSEEVVMNNETRIKISRTKKMALIEAIRKSA